MNKSAKIIVASTLIVGILGVSGFAFGDRGHYGGGWSGKGFSTEKIERMADRLDLSDEQRDAVHEIVDKARPAFREYRKDLREGRKQLMELATRDEFDKAAIASLADNQGKIIAEMIVHGAEVMNDVRAVLTLEQRAEATEMMQNFKKHRKHDKQHGHDDDDDEGQS